MPYLRYLCLFAYTGAQHIYCVVFLFCYPLTNEVAKGYSNATFRPSFRNILVNTLESTSFNGF